MYETGLIMSPCFQNFFHEIYPFDDFYKNHKPDAFLDATVTDYDLGADGDLFKAPETIIEEPVMGTNSMASAIPMISCDTEGLMAHQGIEPFHRDPILSDVFYQCRNDILAKAAIEDSLITELMDVKHIPLAPIGETISDEVSGSFSFQKSVSSGSLTSVEGINGAAVSKPRFLDFPGVDFGDASGMRRAFSEGDIKNLGTGNCNFEDRKEKLLRYRNKKTKRNFGRKIKYACRKALADSQPRIRGRFAKTDECETSKRQ